MQHTIFNKPIEYESSDSSSSIILGAGCFWGVEKKFWSLTGVQMTSVGYAGGNAGTPTYESVCSGSTGHTEVVKIQFDYSIIPLNELLKIFWECHDPTQGNRQGNDIGTQYRSACFCENDNDLEIAKKNLSTVPRKSAECRLWKYHNRDKSPARLLFSRRISSAIS